MKIEERLTAAVVSGLKALYGQDVPEAQVQLQKTKKEFEGHLTLVLQRHQGLPEPHRGILRLD